MINKSRYFHARWIHAGLHTGRILQIWGSLVGAPIFQDSLKSHHRGGHLWGISTREGLSWYSTSILVVFKGSDGLSWGLCQGHPQKIDLDDWMTGICDEQVVSLKGRAFSIVNDGSKGFEHWPMTEKFFDCKTLGCLKKLGSMVSDWLRTWRHLLTNQIIFCSFSVGVPCVPAFSAANPFLLSEVAQLNNLLLKPG